MTRRLAPLAAVLLVGVTAPARAPAQLTEPLVRSYLWPSSPADFQPAEAALDALGSDDALDRMQWHDLVEWMRRGPPVPALAEGRATEGLRGLMQEGAPEGVELLDVAAPGGRTIPVFVRPPSDYTAGRQWPLMLAMHGGPPGSQEGAMGSALRMVSVWTEAAEAAGWIVAAPAMVSVVARDGRTRERLPYEVFHPEEARAVVDAVRARYGVTPDRVVSTGISLGSNLSIGFAAARPDWLSAIVPVSTEGESRETLLRNLSVPVYVLEGAQDRNIRAVAGPRAMSEILTSHGADLVYREFADRAHEGFQEHYADVLRWLDTRPRRRDPREVVRVPHAGIYPLARRVHWIESATRQGIVSARVVAPDKIDVEARRTGAVTLHLNDDLVDLDRPLTIRVNGQLAFEGRLHRSARTALAQARALGDERRVYSTTVSVDVPLSPAARAAGLRLSERLAPRFEEGQLSFWEMYAVRALEERVPDVGFSGAEVSLPAGFVRAAPEQVALSVASIDPEGPAAAAGLRAGDVLLSFGGEPFFEGAGAVAGLHHWLIRELREYPIRYELRIWRDGRELTLGADYALGPYRPPSPGDGAERRPSQDDGADQPPSRNDDA